MVKVGDVVRAPWRNAGDDPDMTGEVIAVKRKRGMTYATARWHDNGTVTPAGDESVFVIEGSSPRDGGPTTLEVVG